MMIDLNLIGIVMLEMVFANEGGVKSQKKRRETKPVEPLKSQLSIPWPELVEGSTLLSSFYFFLSFRNSATAPAPPSTEMGAFLRESRAVIPYSFGKESSKYILWNSENLS